MAETWATFCTKCGARFPDGAAFCIKCGTLRAGPDNAPGAPKVTPGPTATETAEALPRSAAPQATAVVSGAATTVRFATSVAGAAGVGVALPWQTVTSPGPLDGRALLLSFGLPAAQHAIRSSLRRPGIAMGITTALDVLVATITGGLPGLLAALPRMALGGATATLSMLTGSRAGSMRLATGAVAAVTAVVQLGYSGQQLFALFTSGASWLALLPGAIAMLSSLVMAAKTAYVALKGAR